MAPAYWLNDPNGLIYFNGEYHMFYQHNPYAPRWGMMHWGHAKSKDLVHWEYLPIALAPGENYDLDKRGGCFSGSAVDDKGMLTIIYTGAVTRGDKLIQSQCLATSSDGIVFEKYKCNPVITEPPPDGSSDFRDPGVWNHNGKWYMVIGSCKDGKGNALLYCSDNLRKWDYIGVLAESDGSLGYMWECPDFFPIGDKYILTFSPMGMSDSKTIYIVGDMNYRTFKFTWESLGKVDCGFDYYITQSFMDGKGRRIMIGWINAWNCIPRWMRPGFIAERNWCGAMSIPRTVELDNEGYLRFQPVEELEILRDSHIRLEDIEITSGLRKLPEETRDRCLEIIAEFELKNCKAVEFGFNLKCSEDGSEEAVVLYNVKAGELRFVRRRPDLGSEDIKTCKLGFNEGENLKLHIFIDIYFLEIFANDGRICMTNNLYSVVRDINLFASGGTVRMVSLDLWRLRSIW